MLKILEIIIIYEKHDLFLRVLRRNFLENDTFWVTYLRSKSGGNIWSAISANIL